MRRIAAVFASKRSDRSDAASSTAASTTTQHTQQPAKTPSSKRFFRSLSRKAKPVDPLLDRLNSADLHPPSSSSSSSGAPTTPDDDRGSLLRLPTAKVWAPLPPIPVDSRLGSFHHLDAAPHDRSPLSVIPRPSASPSTFDTEDASSEESSFAPDLSRPPERSTPLSAPAYLLALSLSKLRPPYAPPPLLDVPGGPLFPRSCNARRSLPYADSLESTMHRTRLQRRLERGDLSPAETRSIASFAGRRTVLKDRPSLFLDDTAVRTGHARSHSAGLRRWVDRPCFEDRLLVLLAENEPAGGLHANTEPRWTRVEPATGCGVADLEYSLTLELLAGLYEDIPPSEHEQQRQAPGPESSALAYLRLDTRLSLDSSPSLSLTHSPTAPSPSSLSSIGPPSPVTMPSSPPPASPSGASPKPAQPSVISPSTSSRGQLYKASPSPLRMEAVSAPSPAASTPDIPASAPAVSPVVSASIAPSPVTSPPPSASSAAARLKPALKQGVRFAEGEKEDKEDNVPLGYVMRVQQKREEKARFLAAERERRQHEEARRKHEEEKRKWEKERATWEREKRAMEEERKKRLYAEEVAAARARRESSRIGFGPATGEGLAVGQWDRSERPRPDRESSASPSFSRPTYDPAHAMPRTYSDSSLARPPHPSRGSSGSGSGSPEESRPNSVYGSWSGAGSRPPSMHSGVPTPSSSQQDVRPRERRTSSSRRASMVSESGSSRPRSEVPVPPVPVPNMWTMNMPMNMGAPMPMPGLGIPMAMPVGMGMTPMGMPMYGIPMDMPLLPPSPPFMQQYGGRSSSRSRSPSGSHSNSPTLSKRDLSSNNSSSERVNRMSRHGYDSSSGSARGASLPRSESASPARSQRPTHVRTGSGDTSRSNRPAAAPRSHTDHGDRRSSSAKQAQQGVRAAPPPPPSAAAAAAAASSSRPRPTHTSSLPPNPPVAYNQPRSSWALPQSGFENVSRPAGGRRQTIIS
ncbi:hypothetical protein BD309DRAFT_860969 [Dichomitus squalens]|uniref:Uncharacterized protein n=1 Tax=Dichomitus squalens TaxID=114155 RepID=A0A4Q9QA47_9APHY|nr:hypothetical protein BD309DRAFT_860969 [Dichomitus squalens]TBU63921.1 hypothetical protein BD310DRAFT_972979 [Dichomitus squalens]